MNTSSVVENTSIIETEFKDTLTIGSCSVLINEIIKYILYHKQQLPYTFDRLKYVITKKRSLQPVEMNKNRVLTNVERLFRIAEEGLTTLEVLFENTKEEITKRGKVNEVTLLFGGSPLTPKQVYHIHLPEFCCDHKLTTHEQRKHLLHFLQVVAQSNQLNKMLLKPMSPTNMFVFLRKAINNSSSENVGSWFLPKNRFQIPSYGQHFHIKLSNPTMEKRHCSCRGFEIYSDSEQNTLPHLPDPEYKPVDTYENETEWYQACGIFKGFKDVYVNGVSVSDSWTR